MTIMLEENLARLRAHRNNIHRYRRLLNTRLTDTEKAFITRRLDEELRALGEISGSTFPLSFTMPNSSTREVSHV
jgi:hypothetical protein